MTKTFKDSVGLWVELVREQALPLGILFAVSISLSLSLEDVMQAMEKGQEDQRWIYQLALGLVDLVEGVLQMLVLAWGIPKVRQLTEAHFVKHPFQSSYLNSFFAEYLRMLASTLLWALLLVLPGFYRYARLLFVPFITLFCKPYRDDEVDAFELSKALSEGRVGRLVGLVLGSIALQAGLEFLPQTESLHSAWFRTVCGGLSFLLAGYVFALTYLVFERAMEEHRWS